MASGGWQGGVSLKPDNSMHSSSVPIWCHSQLTAEQKGWTYTLSQLAGKDRKEAHWAKVQTECDPFPTPDFAELSCPAVPSLLRVVLWQKCNSCSPLRQSPGFGSILAPLFFRGSQNNPLPHCSTPFKPVTLENFQGLRDICEHWICWTEFHSQCFCLREVTTRTDVVARGQQRARGRSPRRS